MTAKIKLNAASGGGSFSLQAPSSSANNRVMTLPDSADGTILTTTNPKAGNIIQVVQSIYKSAFYQNINADAEFDMTQLTATITPSSSSNKVMFLCNLCHSFETTHPLFCYIKRGGSQISDAIGNQAGSRARVTTGLFTNQNNYDLNNSTIQYLDSPSSTSSLTYGLTFRHGSNGQRAVFINRSQLDTSSYQYARGISTMTLLEIAA